MANVPQKNGIKQSWTLKEFFQLHGKMKRAHLKNNDTGESFEQIAFVSAAGTVFVGISSQLGNITDAEIKNRRNELQVCELNVAPEVLESRRAKGQQLESYSLCAVGNGSWEDIDISWD
jgi:hypothetical protein